MIFAPGAFYVMDRGYMDFRRLNRIASSAAFFVTRAKDSLRIKHYYGNSPNAVKMQIWIAVAILHKQLSLPGALHRTLQLLSVHSFEKIPLHQILT